MLFIGNVALFPKTFAAPETWVSFPIVCEWFRVRPDFVWSELAGGRVARRRVCVGNTGVKIKNKLQEDRLDGLCSSELWSLLINFCAIALWSQAALAVGCCVGREE